MHNGVDWGPSLPWSWRLLPPSRRCGARLPVWKSGVPLSGPVCSSSICPHLLPCIPVLGTPQAPPQLGINPLESAGTCSQVRTGKTRPGRSPLCPGPLSRLLPLAPSAVASRFGVLFGEGEAFIVGTLFTLGLDIFLPSKPFLEST